MKLDAVRRFEGESKRLFESALSDLASEIATVEHVSKASAAWKARLVFARVAPNIHHAFLAVIDSELVQYLHRKHYIATDSS